MATSTIPVPAATVSKSDAPRRRSWIAFVTLVVLLFGGLEGWYGKTDSGDVYGSDAVQYLDCARAIARHDWHSALNPLWSQGYPTLLALAHALLPVSAQDRIETDWLATRFVNFAIFAFCWFTFCLFLAEVSRVRRLSTSTLSAAVLGFFTAQV